MLRKLLKEPLIHFLFAGFLLFCYFRSYSNDTGTGNTILVHKENLLNFMQFQSKAFNKDVFSDKLAQFSEKEKQQLIQNYIKDEALYREAVKLGLDQNDFVIKRRVIQKMEFILDDFDAPDLVVKEDSLQAYYEQNKQRYYQDAQFTFTHIFFKDRKEQAAIDQAIAFKNNSLHQKLSAAESLQYGDRFLYHRNYSEKTISFLDNQFGLDFGAALSTFSPNKTKWQGPISSEHGQHLILLVDKSNAQVPNLKNIYSTVKTDYIEHLKKQHKQQRIDQLIEDYQVKIKL